MKWSKLKKTIEQRFAESLKGRVQLYTTRYTSRSFYMVRAWITVDGKEIANFSTPDTNNRFGWSAAEMTERIKDDERTEGNVVEKGEFWQWEFMEACWEYLNMDIKEALNSINPILKSLAVLDARVGKRRLVELKTQTDQHPLVKTLLLLRLEAEGLAKKTDI